MKPPALLPTLRALALLPLLVALGGCSLLGGGKREPVTIYSPQVAVQPDPSWPQAGWQLSIAKPTAARLVDSPRIAVRPAPGELQVYRGSSWAQPPTDMIEASVLRVLEDSGKIAGVGRLATGMRSDYRLALDVRRFDSQPGDHALIEGAWQLRWRHDGKLATQACTSRISETVGPGYDALVQGHQQALNQLAEQMAGVARALASGQSASCPEG